MWNPLRISRLASSGINQYMYRAGSTLTTSTRSCEPRVQRMDFRPRTIIPHMCNMSTLRQIPPEAQIRLAFHCPFKLSQIPALTAAHMHRSRKAVIICKTEQPLVSSFCTAERGSSFNIYNPVARIPLLAYSRPA